MDASDDGDAVSEASASQGAKQAGSKPAASLGAASLSAASSEQAGKRARVDRDRERRARTLFPVANLTKQQSVSATRQSCMRLLSGTAVPEPSATTTTTNPSNPASSSAAGAHEADVDIELFVPERHHLARLFRREGTYDWKCILFD